MIYLDYNATTPLAPEAEAEMSAAQRLTFANASSRQHVSGDLAAQVVERATTRAADSLGVPAPDLVWCSGATEALRWSIIGTVLSSPAERRHIVIGATEHKAALDAAFYAQQFLGATVSVAAANAYGVVDADSIAGVTQESTCLAVVMAANNETGVLNPIDEIGRVCQSLGLLLLTDMTQAVGKVDLDPYLHRADLAVCSAHKFYGPKGVGLLIATRELRDRLSRALPGGKGSGLRSGTANHAAIAGASVALETAVRDRGQASGRYEELVDLLLVSLNQSGADFMVTSHSAQRVSNTVNLRFPGADAEAVMANMPEVAVATGSACNSGSTEPSHVLLSMGLTPTEADECLRFSVGQPTTKDEICIAAQQVAAAVARVRRITAA